MASTLNAKQMRTLLQSISTDPQLKQSKDSILLAEDQYPESLDAIFTRLTTPTTLQNTLDLLKWNRKSGGTNYDAELTAITIKSQDYMRATYQFTATAESPWDTYTFRQWKYFVTNLCLSAVQEALKAGDNAKSMQHLFAPDRDQAAGAAHNTKKNVQGMLLYHPIILNSPWQAPDDLDKQIDGLLTSNEPALVARSLNVSGHTSYDQDNAIKAIDVLTTSIKQTLLRIYKMTSHSFHVLLSELIPKARVDQSHLFTHLKGARTDHIINLRAHHAKTRVKTLPALTAEELKPHSAEHTLKFLMDEYVEQDDDAPHHTWSNILTATRQPRVALYAWVDSFTLLALRYGETVKKITSTRQVKINRTVSKQITDEEKLVISTINPAYSAVVMNSGHYTFTDLVKLLAQNATSFTKKYIPAENPRITRYLNTRSAKYQGMVENMTQVPKGKGKGNPIKKLKIQDGTQRGWVYVTDSGAPGLVAPPPYEKGKGYKGGKGKSKMGSKGKGPGKGKYSFAPKGKGKGKGKSKGLKGKRAPKGKPWTGGLTPVQSAVKPPMAAQNGALIKCHFCHAEGHIKPNCRKWLALSQTEKYQQRNSHETKYQLIYDHLEDSLLAPRLCQYCPDDNCNGQNCASPFNVDDYNEASLFFTQSLSEIVANAKLDRPLDSPAPQTEDMYHYNDEDWGENYENWYGNQYSTGEEYAQMDDAYEAYPTEQDYGQEHYETNDQEQEEDLDEDDQDNYE